MVEEQHVTQYGSLIDPNASMCENMLMHEYIECYLYFSMLNDETDKNIKKIWEMLFEQELSHLHEAVKLIRKYEKKDWSDVIPNGDFPELIKFKPHKEYIRKILGDSVTLTADRDKYIEVSKLDDNAEFFKYQKKVNSQPEKERGHTTIVDHIKKFGEDYRVEDKPHPVKELKDRKEDNFTLGREK